MQWIKHTIMTVALLAVSVPFLYPLIGVEDAPPAPVIWLLVWISTALNVFVIIYHFCVPPHPKFMMLSWRRWVLRTHLLSGSVELLSGLTACFLTDSPIPAIVMAVTALCFHVPSALLQTPIAFGTKAILTPAYLLGIGLHGFCAINLLIQPTSQFWLTNTFLIFNVYVWCRIYLYFFDWLRLFEPMKYTVSILAASTTLLPALLGPATLLVPVVFIGTYVVLYRFLYITSPEEYRDFVRERARDSAINSELMGLLEHDVNPEEDERLARQFFQSLASNGDKHLTSADISRGLLGLRIPKDAVEHFVSRQVQNEPLDFTQFRDKVWSVRDIRRRAVISVAARGAKSERDKAQVVFQQIDLDKDGRLAKFELKPLLTEWGLPESEVQRYLNRFDADHDGAISFDEFFHGMKRVWQFIYYDVVQSRTMENTEMIGRFAASVKDERTTKATETTLRRDLIGRVPFLEGADRQLLDDLAASLVSESLPAGKVLFSERQAGDTFYLIHTGVLDVVKGGEPIARLSAGACIGEGALLSDAPRSATALAATDCRLFGLTRSSFQFILSKYPGVAERLRQIDTARRAETTKLRLSSHLLDDVPFLKSASEDLLSDLAGKLVEEIFEPGTVIFSEGDRGDRLYMIVAGTVRLSKGDMVIAELGVGACFGEGTVLTDAPRSATAIAVDAVSLYSLHRAAFEETFERYPGARESLESLHHERRVSNVRHSIEKNLLLRVPFLRSASDALVADLAESLERKEFEAGETIFAEHDAGDAMYLIESGLVRIFKGETAIADVGLGATIGEGSLLTDEPRTATAIAMDKTIAFKLGREDFQRIVDTYPAIRDEVVRLHKFRSKR